MSEQSRRNFLSSTLGAASCLAMASAGAQSATPGLTDEQRNEYARAFQQSGGAAPSAAPGLTAEERNEYARVFQRSGAANQELSVLSDIQNNRLSLPSGMENFRQFLKQRPAMKAMSDGQTPELGILKIWHDLALDATALDHTTAVPVAPPTFGEQFGPTRTSRALAIVHIAILEAVNAITQKYHSYKDIQTGIYSSVGVTPGQVTATTASVDRAIVEAAYATLAALYPNKKSMFDNAHVLTVPMIGDGANAQELGERIGKSAAAIILLIRQNDRSDMHDLSADDFGSSNPLDWRKDLVVPVGPALGGNWHRVTPFVLASSDAHRPAPPPGPDDPIFIAAFKDVRRLGRDPNAPTLFPRWPTPTQRSGHQTTPPFDDTNESFKGVFWAYDGTPGLCAPPRLYNMVATSIAMNEKPITTVTEYARMLALINIAMADAGIAAWEAKYHYAFARPVTAIRATGADGTAEGQRDPNWTPLGAPVSNGFAGQRNLTPPFPAYPSGHATFGGALFETLRITLGLPAGGVPFDFVSDEYNGHNRGPGDSAPRPMVTRHFGSFTAAAVENAQSRIWLGIHWQFDADAGIVQGQQIAAEVCAGTWTPV